MLIFKSNGKIDIYLATGIVHVLSTRLVTKKGVHF